MKATPILLLAALVPLISHAARPVDEDPYHRALRLAPLVLKESCPPYLMRTSGASFIEAPIACDAFLTSALVSLAVEKPERTAEVLPVVDRLIEQALGSKAKRAFAATGGTVVGGETLPNSVLYRGFLLLMLEGRERLQLGGPRAKVGDALAAALARDFAATKLGYLPSFGVKQIWPCDQSPAASGLILHGQLHHDDATRKAGEALRDRLVADLHRPRGFPTAYAPSGKILIATPRATTMAWTAAFLGVSSPESGEAFAVELFKRFCDRKAAFTACREWPRGVDNPPDSDSGPLIFGYAVGSSALALAAARIHPDGAAFHQELLGTARRYGLDSILDPLNGMKLENAIYIWGRSVRPWV
ncbi:MAG TPA: hypothetical protein VFA20_17460 [Myxococcaceae bacterium]|nr:hypothetical protein [Myxococcaceae bacterium]